jgi:hypothetical protein
MAFRGSFRTKELEMKLKAGFFVNKFGDWGLISNLSPTYEVSNKPSNYPNALSPNGRFSPIARSTKTA